MRRCARDGIQWPRDRNDRSRVVLSLQVLPWDGLYRRVEAYERRSLNRRSVELGYSHHGVLGVLRHGVASARRGVCSITRGWHDPVQLTPVCVRHNARPGMYPWCERSKAPESFCVERPS